MEYKEDHIEMTIEEAIEFGMPKDIGKFGEKVILSYEAVEDIVYKEKVLNCVKFTEPFTEEEMEAWRKANEYLDNLNWEEARKRVKLIKN